MRRLSLARAVVGDIAMDIAQLYGERAFVDCDYGEAALGRDEVSERIFGLQAGLGHVAAAVGAHVQRFARSIEDLLEAVVGGDAGVNLQGLQLGQQMGER